MWSENTLPVFLNVLRLALWSRIWSWLNLQYAIVKNVYSAVVGWNVLCMWLSIWLTVCYLGLLYLYWFFDNLLYPLLRKESCNLQLYLWISLFLFSIFSVFVSWILKPLLYTSRTVMSWFQQFNFYVTLCSFSSCFFSLRFAELLGPVSSDFLLILEIFLALQLYIW